MAISVDSAFNEFMRDYVNLDPDVVQSARDSRDNLLDRIKAFDNKDNFFDLCEAFNLHFGSFSRKTKCRELDDIDLMIGIAASGATYNSNDPWDDVTITAGSINPAQRSCRNGDGSLNSTQVLNCFKKELEKLPEYHRSEPKKNGEAITLYLKTKELGFDIVPCFHTVIESNGRAYYLIPNGRGAWKKTDPTIEKTRISEVNKKHNGKVLNTIRLIKYWNKRGKMPTIASYLIETMVVDYFERIDSTPDFIEQRFRNVLLYIRNNIFSIVNDSKGIEGNINSLSTYERQRIYDRAGVDYNKATDAINAECNEKDQHKAINIWRDILGDDFPTYG